MRKQGKHFCYFSHSFLLPRLKKLEISVNPFPFLSDSFLSLRLEKACHFTETLSLPFRFFPSSRLEKLAVANFVSFSNNKKGLKRSTPIKPFQALSSPFKPFQAIFKPFSSLPAPKAAPSAPIPPRSPSDFLSHRRRDGRGQPA